MNTVVKQNWLAAMRSGEYTKGRKALCDKKKFCCLGVLCDLYAKEHPEIQWDSSSSYTTEKRFLGEYAYLPEAVRLWAGLDKNDPYIDMKDGYIRNISFYNDSLDSGDDFTKIADIIEKQL